MIKFNTQKVIAKQAAERAKPKPLPKVLIKAKAKAENKPEVIITVDDSKFIEKIESVLQESENLILHQLEKEYADIRLERDKLSTRISFLVEEGATTEKLQEHYNNIESYRVPMQRHYDLIQYVKQHGEMPTVRDDEQDAETLYELKDKKRKLVDKRCKLQVKLKPSAKPSSMQRINFWQLELEQANADYLDVENRIKKLEGRI